MASLHTKKDGIALTCFAVAMKYNKKIITNLDKLYVCLDPRQKNCANKRDNIVFSDVLHPWRVKTA